MSEHTYSTEGNRMESDRTTTLGELAKTVRSKNAGTDRITFDIIFRDRETYDHVRRSGAVTRESVCSLFNVTDDRITDFVNFDPAYAIKFTLQRTVPSGSPGERDVFGCQQYPPLLDVEVPALESARVPR